MGKKKIHAADYAIFIIMIVVTLGIGLFNGFTGGKQKTLEEYFVGNRKLRLVPIILSMVASLYSSILILGFPAEVYTRGGSYWLYAVGIALGALMAAGLFVPVFHPLKLTSMNHYLWDRFNSRFVVIIGTFVQLSLSILQAAIPFFGAAATLGALTPIPVWTSIVVGALITIIYTTIGGIKGVVWTDVLQALMMMATLIAVCVQSIRKVGGFTEVWENAERWDRLDFLNFDPDPHVRFSFWGLIIGAGFQNLNRYGTTQVTVQRFCSLPTITKAVLSMLGLIPVIVVMVSLASISGLGMFAFYTKNGCDPLRTNDVRNVNQLIPHFVMDQLNYPGIPGILLAGLIAASLSTASSFINSAAALTWDDVLQPIWPNLRESHAIIITKLLVALYGLISMGLAFVIGEVGGTLVQFIITFASATGGPNTALFLLGIFCPFVDWIGAAAGVIGGCIFGMWVGFGAYTIQQQLNILNSTTATCPNMTITPGPSTIVMTTSVAATTSMPPPLSPLHNLYSISYLWLSFFAMLVGLTVGLIVSLIRMFCVEEKAKVEGHLLHPIMRYILKLPNEQQEASEKDLPDYNVVVTKM